jgi:hypothetical protein
MRWRAKKKVRDAVDYVDRGERGRKRAKALANGRVHRGTHLLVAEGREHVAERHGLAGPQ